MRIFLKVLLFPLTLALTLLVLFLRFLCMASAVVLNILSGFVLLVTLAALVVLQEPLRAVWQYFSPRVAPEPLRRAALRGPARGETRRGMREVAGNLSRMGPTTACIFLCDSVS